MNEVVIYFQINILQFNAVNKSNLNKLILNFYKLLSKTSAEIYIIYLIVQNYIKKYIYIYIHA